MYSMARRMVEKRQHEKGDDEDETHGFASKAALDRSVKVAREFRQLATHLTKLLDLTAKETLGNE
jgi:hypothetical protein